MCVLLYRRDEHVQAAILWGSLPGLNGTSQRQSGRLAFLARLSVGIMPGNLQQLSNSLLGATQIHQVLCGTDPHLSTPLQADSVLLPGCVQLAMFRHPLPSVEGLSNAMQRAGRHLCKPCG